MALDLIPGVRTQGISWSYQEVHHCDTYVIVSDWPYIYGPNTNPVNMISTTYVQSIPAVHTYFANIIARPPDLAGRRANDTAKGGASTQP